MWQADASGFVLKPKADMLEKWLPALSRDERFAFRPDVQIEYVQECATPAHEGSEALCFVRDPRDALYSMYRRSDPQLSFMEYLELPNPHTLLDRIDHWLAAGADWRQIEGLRLYRFEDYKADARALLARILDDLSIAATDAAIDRAVAESSSEKARAAEALYRRAIRTIARSQTAPAASATGASGRRSRTGSRTSSARPGRCCTSSGTPWASVRRRAATPRSSRASPSCARCSRRRSPRRRGRTMTAGAAARVRDRRGCVAAAPLPHGRGRGAHPARQSRGVLRSTRTRTCAARLRSLRGEFEDGTTLHFERLRALLAERRRSGSS